MAGQSITFDFLSRGAATVAGDFRKTGDNAALAARGAKILGEAIEKLGTKEGRTAEESKILARALRETGDAEDRVTARAVLADAAVRRLDDAVKAAAKKREAELKVKVDDSELGRLKKALGGLKGSPGLLGPAVALAPAAGVLAGVAGGAAAGLAGAFVAGGLALAAFGAVAKPVLTDAKTAATAVEKAQNNYSIAIANGTKQSVAYKAEQIAIAKAYANLSPAQIALSKQLGAMASAWDKVKTAETPVVAGALQPWLKSITGLTQNLAPIIAKIAPVIAPLGGQFNSLVNSSAFKGFRDFIGSTGSAAVSAGGSTIIDLVKSFMILLPKFDPLIREAIGWIGRLGPAVLTWSSSKKASDDITRFLQWFSRNGPVVGGLLKNIGGALAALAPGLTSGGAAELNAMSGFFGFVAKLPPSIAKPLAEVAGALLILNKLGVVKAGVQLTGWTFGKGAAAAGGQAAAGAEGAAAGGLMARLTPGLKWAVKGGLLIAGAKIALSIAASQAPAAAPKDAAHFQKSTPGAVKKFLGFFFGGDVNTENVSAYLHHLFGGAANWGPQEVFDLVRHKIAVQWDGIRGDIHHYWNMTWTETIGRAIQGGHDVEHIWNVLMSDIAATFDIAKEGIRITWDKIKLLFLSGTDFIMTTMGHLPGPLGAPFRAAHVSIKHEMDGIQRDVVTATGNMQASIDRLHGKNVPISVTGSGKGGVVITTSGIAAAGQGNVRFTAGAAQGLFIDRGTGPTADDVMIRASKGELVVPAGMVRAGAVDHLRGRIPGFASGGFLGVENALGRVTGVAAGVEGRGAAAAMAAGAKAAIAREKAAVTSAFSATKVPNVGSGIARWAPLVKQALAMEGLNPGLILQVLYQIQTESGGNPNAINLTDSNAAAGDPSRGLLQTIGSTFRAYHWPGTSNNIYDPLANIAAAINYARHRYGPALMSGGMGLGSGHGYAQGGLVGYASGGTVGKQGAAYLHAWRTRHGGGYGAAWGPIPVNAQIDAANRVLGRDTTLAGASLPAAQHKHYVAAAAWWKRHRDALVRERGVMRDWRGQLGGSDAAITGWIAAAGSNKALAPSVKRWKGQRAFQEKEIAAVSGMLGWSAAQQAAIARAHPPGKGKPPVTGVQATHTYGGDVANNLGTVLAAALGPFTGAARGGMVFDSGGTLRPGFNPVWNNTGRPESLVPARGGGGTHLHLTVNGPVGSQRELEDWFVQTANKTAQHGRLSQAVKAASR